MGDIAIDRCPQNGRIETEETGMSDAVAKLKRVIDDPRRYEIPHGEVAALQIEAADELFQSRKSAIRFLGHRAEESGVTRVRSPEDLVGLLFAHSTYKSYPEAWLSEQRWKQLGKWVDTMSTHRVKGIDLADIESIDDWIDRMGHAGHFLACSSGTTGKSAILNASTADMEWARKNAVYSQCWGASIEPRQQFRQFSAAAVASTPRTRITSEAMAAAFACQDVSQFKSPAPPITLGQITGMVALRKRIADGVAMPEEIATYDATAAERQANLDRAVVAVAEGIVAARNDNLFIAGMWGHLHKVAELVRSMGFSGGAFSGENVLFVAGGLKGAVLPANYREFIFETFNIAPDHISQNYSMQEIATAMPRCRAGRYHLPPWLMCLILDESGENLLPITSGEVVGRAGFFDISIDGRWNGIISGDKIALMHEHCECGAASPSIRDDITRYADLAGGDKIACSGTVDAYVRGLS
jgi:hypothetical protein